MHPGKQETQYQSFFQAVQRRLSQQAFETWFRPLRLSTDSGHAILRIATPNRVVKDWILSKYAQTLQDSLAESNLAALRLEWTTTSENSTFNDAVPAAFVDAELSPMIQNTPAPDLVREIPLSDLSRLNDKYTFSSLVVASCNRLAHAAAKAVAEAPGQAYNPLYIYGGVGLGKTHLIQATGHAIAAAKPELRIAYLSIERFMNELISAIRYGYDKTNAFRERYRSIDVLLIDDVQFIAGKERTQEEFFHTFNALYDRQKQIVLTSDCPPREIPEIEERLHSRFEWGLIADLEPPDLETKIAILRRKAELQRAVLPDDVALFLASNSKHNIRELEGALIRVSAMASLRGMSLTKSLAQDAMRNVAQVSEGTSITIPMIQRIVADYYKISVDDLKARSNMRHLLLPRQVAMYLCKKLTSKSYP